MTAPGQMPRRATVRPLSSTAGPLPTLNRSDRPEAPPTRWMERAACAGAADDFVAPSTPDQGAPLADRYCSACPVAARCLAFGRGTRAYGLRGGRVLLDGRPAERVIQAVSA